MKLNTGIISDSLPFKQQYVCGQPNHQLILSDIRILSPDCDIYSESIIYFTEWPTLTQLTNGCPKFVVCVGGSDHAYKFFEANKVTGIILDEKNPIIVFGIIQSIFQHYNELENKLFKALLLKESTQEILNICADFFQNQAVLFDCDFKIIDYSTNYSPDEDNPYWKEMLLTKKRSEKLFQQTKKMNTQHDPTALPRSELIDLGSNYPRSIINSFYDSSKRIASLVIIENNKPLSANQLESMDYISELIATCLTDRYSTLYGSLDNLRAIFVTYLNKVNVDPILATNCLSISNWSLKDDYRLILVYFPSGSKNSDTLTRYLYIYENIFPDCIAFKYIESIVLVIHNDTEEVMASCLPKLEKQLSMHNAVCGVSFPFNSIRQINSQYINADIAIQHGDQTKRIRFQKDIITNYIINQIANYMPLIPLCHREALRVYDYDLENGTDLLLTLETYLRQNKSQKAAADELYIHRSTLVYRLGCIDKLAKIDYEDPRERVHLLLSCIVLRNLGNRQANVAPI